MTTRPYIAGDILAHHTHKGHLLVTRSQDAAGQVSVAVAEADERARAYGVAVYDVRSVDGRNIPPIDAEALDVAGWSYAGRAIPKPGLFDVDTAAPGVVVCADNGDKHAHCKHNQHNTEVQP